MTDTAIKSAPFWSQTSSRRTGLRISTHNRRLTSKTIVRRHLKFSVVGTHRNLTPKRDGSRSQEPKRSTVNAPSLQGARGGSVVVGNQRYGTEARWIGASEPSR